MVDIDPEEINKNRGIKIDIPVVCDAKQFINDLIENSSTLEINKSWSEYLKKVKKINEKRNVKKSDLTSYEFLSYLNEKIPGNSVIIPDEGGNLVWSMQSIKIRSKQKLYSNFGNSSMGYALPSAIGSCLANKGPVICIDGDGGIQMNIQELQTIKHYNLPIKIFILNNNCYGIIKQFQDSYFNKRYIATESKDYSAPDFVKVATAYGINAYRATKENYEKIINLALINKGPTLVDVIIDKGQKLTPKLEYGNPLEDMSPYQTDKQIKTNMIIKTIPRRDNSSTSWVNLKI
jgi:acetolactate synthase-1/2/3 large subunit